MKVTEESDKAGLKLSIQKRQRNQRSNYQHLLDHRKKLRVPEKTYTSASLTTPKTLTVWIIINYEIFFKRWGYQTTLPASCETCMQVKKKVRARHRTADWELGKEYIKAVYCHPVYLTYMQSTSCEMLSWMKQKLESRLLGEISITSDMQMTSP